MYVIISPHFFICIPVVDGTGSEVCVEDSDDGRCCVSQNGIIDDVQEVNQLKQTNTDSADRQNGKRQTF